MGQRQTREIRRALTWGGRLMVMAPLLGREAHGHGPAVFDLHTVAPGEAAGPLGVDQNGLPGAAVADQKLTVPDLQNLSLKDSCLHGFQI